MTVLNNNVKKSLPAILLICIVFVISTITSLVLGIPVSDITKGFNYSVIIIMITMELFTNLVVETGIMQFIATKVALFSKGSKKKCLVLFGLMMFFVSAFLNNITAVMIVLPVMFVLLKALTANKDYICLFFSVILALSNTGGAASPIGDFPAILIMSSGITSFSGYLFGALPLFFITSSALLSVWVLISKKDELSKVERLVAVDLLYSRYRNISVRYDVLIPLIIVMLGMFIAWSIIPQNIVPPEIVAIIGYSLSMVIASIKGVKIQHNINMKSVLTISSFLFLATVVSASGILMKLALILETAIPDSKLLLIVVMIITSLVAGLVSAGPASAAMLPVIVNLCNTTLSSQSDLVAIAYAASICAGSSLFLWSATAGFILSGKIEDEAFENEGKIINWGIKEYLKPGIINYFIQMTIAIIWIMASI